MSSWGYLPLLHTGKGHASVSVLSFIIHLLQKIKNNFRFLGVGARIRIRLRLLTRFHSSPFVEDKSAIRWSEQHNDGNGIQHPSTINRLVD